MTNDTLDITFYPKKTTRVFGFILCVLFTVTAIAVGIIEGWPWPAYLLAGVFALTTLVVIIQLLPGCSYLHVNDEGFTICDFFRKTSIPWSAVDEFFATQHGFVGLNFAPSHQNPLPTNIALKKLMNCDFALPKHYGRDPEDLAAFMNECRLTAGGPKGSDER